MLPAFIVLVASAVFADTAKQNDDGVISIEIAKPAAKVTTDYTATRWGMYEVASLTDGDKPAAGGVTVSIGDRKATIENGHTLIFIKDGKNAITAESTDGKAIRGLFFSPASEGKPIVQAEDGSITLGCADATVHGVTLRYESAPAKNCLGYWVKEKDWASWTFDVKTPGTFNLTVLAGSNGGSAIEIKVGEQALKFTTKNTGNIHNHAIAEAGTVTIDKPGPVTLSFKPTKKVGGAIMDLRAIYLRPAAK